MVVGVVGVVFWWYRTVQLTEKGQDDHCVQWDPEQNVAWEVQRGQ